MNKVRDFLIFLIFLILYFFYHLNNTEANLSIRLYFFSLQTPSLIYTQRFHFIICIHKQFYYYPKNTVPPGIMSITRKNSMKMVSGFINNIGAGDSKFFDEEANPDKIKKLLDNASINKQSGINERLRALKWLLAQTTSGKDVSQFFPDVVKNVIVKDVEVKKFVYMYLSYYADQDDTTRELALLSINSFQRDMSSPNMLLRSLALRVMCSIRIRDIIQLQMLAVSTCARDSSPYVRKTAAYALPKLYRLDPEQKPQLVEILSKLIGDKSILVFGSALASFNEICPNQLGM